MKSRLQISLFNLFSTHVSTRQQYTISPIHCEMTIRNQADKKVRADTIGGAFVHYATATIFGSGVIISGMADTRRANAFFNLNNITEGTWDYTLGVVMASAVTTIVIGRKLVVLNLVKPIRNDEFAYVSIPRTKITPGFIAGAALFGLGWSFSGACPGPLFIIASSTEASNTAALVISTGFFFGSFLSRRVHRGVAFATAGLLAALTYTYEDELLLSYLRTGANTVLEPLVRPAIFGGVAIGLATVLLEAFEGKILGVSGIVGGLLNRKAKSSDLKVRAAFVAGLVTAANTTGRLLKHRLVPPSIPGETLSALTVGTLIGVGTSLGSGCTSGHGLCGLSRFSLRSLAAVCTFMAVNAAVSTYLV